MKNNLLFFYAGFPKSFTYNMDINPVSLKKLKNLNSNVYLIKNKDLEKIASFLLKEKGFNKVKGIHFPTLFDKLLKNEDTLSEIQVKDFTCIYSIGKEAAVNKEFAGAILNYFIDQAVLNKKVIFLEGISKNDMDTYYKVSNVSISNLIL